MLKKWYSQFRLTRINGWGFATGAGAIIVLLPVLFVISSLFEPPSENWPNVKQYLLEDYIIGSVQLTLYTVAAAALIGLLLAWLITGYQFPLRTFFQFALLLPLTIPSYILAYTYSNMTSYTGVIQATLRNTFGIHMKPGIIEVMSMRGAVFVLTLSLFPYVYMLVRTFLTRQSAVYIESARLLGHRNWSLFWRVVLPLSRPALAASSMLVLFEVQSDYGVSSYFGVQTVSNAIFQTWFGMYDVDSALRLGAWLLVVVVGIFIMERFIRSRRKYTLTSSKGKPLVRKKLTGFSAWTATAFCMLIWLIAYLLPVVQLISWSGVAYSKMRFADLGELIYNSASGAMISTCIIIVIATIVARTVSHSSSPAIQAMARLMMAGYAIPGAIIAIGVLAVFIALDARFSWFYSWLGKGESALVLSMSVIMLFAGFVIRFMATGFSSIESGYEKIPRSFWEASRTLGHSSTRTFVRVELPLLKSSILTGFLLTFVEIIKELPLTLLLSPFNFNTLSTRVYRYATDERMYEAAPPSLLLIAISFISVITIWRIEKEKIA